MDWSITNLAKGPPWALRVDGALSLNMGVFTPGLRLGWFSMDLWWHP